MNDENESYWGLGMSAPSDEHQVSSSEIILNFYERFGISAVAPAIAAMKKPERIPDLVFCRLGTNLIKIDKNKDIVMTIELVKNKRNYDASLNSIELTFKLIPSLREAFLYNFRSTKWTRVTYDKTSGLIRQEPDNDFTEYFGFHLNTLVATDDATHMLYRAKERVSDRIKRNLSSLVTNECATNTLLSTKPKIKTDIALLENKYSKKRLPETDIPIMAIKITLSPDEEEFAIQCAEMAFKHAQSLGEYFVYNMHSNRWTRLSNEGNNIKIEKGKDYSRVLGKYMRTMVR